MKKAEQPAAATAARQITQHIAELSDWRGKMLTRLRKLITTTDREATEEWKWGAPVWSHNGNLVAIGAFKDYLKINFFQGAALPDPRGLFNAGLEAKVTRAIDLHEGDPLNEAALKELIQAAVAYNLARAKKK